MLKYLLFAVVFLFLARQGFAQDTTSRLKIIASLQEYKACVINDNDNRMVEIKTQIPNIVYDLKYASTSNFMHRRMYPKGTRHTFMRKPALEALANVQQELNNNGLGLKIFDAYRPYAVAQKFWELVKDERYVANPSKGSNHNRGTAVDLTIINLHTGKELPMGTGFDNFTDTAHHAFIQLPKTVLENRKLLRSVMENNGFIMFDTEWWHYTFKTTKLFDILDIAFTTLLRQ